MNHPAEGWPRRVTPEGVARLRVRYDDSPGDEHAAVALSRGLRLTFAGREAMALLEGFLRKHPLSPEALRDYLALLREQAPREGIARLAALYPRAQFPFVADALMDVRIPALIDFYAAFDAGPARLPAVRALTLDEYASAARLAWGALQASPDDGALLSTLCCAVAMGGQYGKYDAQLAVADPRAGEAIASIRAVLQGGVAHVHPDAVGLFARIAVEIANTLPEHGAVTWLEMVACLPQIPVERAVLEELAVIRDARLAFRYARRCATVREDCADRARMLDDASDWAALCGRAREALACLRLAGQIEPGNKEREERIRFLSSRVTAAPYE